MGFEKHPMYKTPPPPPERKKREEEKEEKNRYPKLKEVVDYALQFEDGEKVQEAYDRVAINKEETISNEDLRILKLWQDRMNQEKKSKEKDSAKTPIVPPPPPPPLRRQEQMKDEESLRKIREKLEKEKTIEKFLKESSSFISLHLPAELSPYGGGYYEMEDERKIKRPIDVSYNARDQFSGRGTRLEGFRSEVQKHNIDEFIDIRHVESPIIEEEKVAPVKFLGLITVEDGYTKTKVVGNKRFKHSEIVSNGKDEDAVSFYYGAGGFAHPEESKDWVGRRGKMLSAEIILPKSEAEELQKILDKDPTFIRELVERIAISKLESNKIKGEGTGQEKWTKAYGQGSPLKPSWEKQDAKPEGSRIYIQKSLEMGGSKGFQEKNVRVVKK